LDSLHRQQIYLFSIRSRSVLWPAQRVVFPEVKRPGPRLRMVELYLHPSMERCLIKPRDVYLFICYYGSSRDSDWLWGERERGRSSSPGRVKNFLSSASSRPALGFTQPPIQRVPEALSPVVKRPGREADHSSPINTEFKRMWIYNISTSPHAFME
jgi:hypothetical protein